MCLCEQEQVSGGTTSTVLRNLLPDTSYKVTVVPVYPEGEGLRLSDQGQTRKSIFTPPDLQHTFSSLQGGNSPHGRQVSGKVTHVLWRLRQPLLSS